MHKFAVPIVKEHCCPVAQGDFALSAPMSIVIPILSHKNSSYSSCRMEVHFYVPVAGTTFTRPERWFKFTT